MRDLSLQVGVVAAFVHFSKEAVNKKKENLLTESDHSKDKL